MTVTFVLLYFGDKDLINATFIWLQQECNADLQEAVTDNRYTTVYLEGDGLPKGDCPIDINCTRIVDKVYAFEILPF